jgi:hypothetical protein
MPAIEVGTAVPALARCHRHNARERHAAPGRRSLLPRTASPHVDPRRRMFTDNVQATVVFSGVALLPRRSCITPRFGTRAWTSRFRTGHALASFYTCARGGQGGAAIFALDGGPLLAGHALFNHEHIRLPRARRWADPAIHTHWLREPNLERQRCLFGHARVHPAPRVHGHGGRRCHLGQRAPFSPIRVRTSERSAKGGVLEPTVPRRSRSGHLRAYGRYGRRRRWR